MRSKLLNAIVLVLLAEASWAASPRPKDFDAFWGDARRKLASLPLEPRLDPDPAHSDGEISCFKASYVSLNKVVVHARYCRPARDGVYPAILISPWYSQGAVEPPIGLARKGFAALAYQGRGFEVDRSSYPLENSWYILSGIGSPRTYVYREIVSHALRGLDFLAKRPEVDPKRIAAMGASQGGGLSLLAAGLDARVAAVAADFPFLSSWETSLAAPQPPYAAVRRYIEEHPAERAAVMKTLSYFDALDVAERIKVPALVQVGLKDRTCPPEGVKAVYARIASRQKRLKEYPQADHGDENAARWEAMSVFLAGRLSAP
ncbi:MAG: acetylxylan esterase [Elusimicrobia bacterium]|nr:acetylxylan esterase [Elusimicrobiota bacterium]